MALHRTTLRKALLLLLLPLLFAGGCFGYQVGGSGLYRPDIRTVHVPIIRSESFRPEVGERLTEAVAKTIEQRTTYKVAGSALADSVLVGRIIDNSKKVVAENINDDPRDLEVSYVIELDWYDRQGRRLIQRGVIPLPGAITIGATSHLIPEAGQSYATAEQESLDRLADQIVDQLEMPW
jgi:hypothetical protein